MRAPGYALPAPACELRKGGLRDQRRHFEEPSVELDALDALAQLAVREGRYRCLQMRQLIRSLRQLLRLDDPVTRLRGDEARVLEQCLVEAEQRRNASDLVFAQGAQHPPPRVLAVDPVHNDLRDQGVVEADHLAARGHTRIDPDARPRRLPVARDPPRAGQKAVRRVLRVDPALDRVPGQPDVVLAQR